MMDAIGNIMAIFDETLGDSANDMTIRGCIIAPSDTDNPNPEVITLFENIDKFKEFMENNKNTLPAVAGKDCKTGKTDRKDRGGGLEGNTAKEAV